MNLELSMWLLGGALIVLSVLFGTVWKMLRDETKMQAEDIKQKASIDRLSDMEKRFSREVDEIKIGHKEVIENMGRRHEKDMDTMQAGFKEQISSVRHQIMQSENNILAQMKIMFDKNK